VVIRVMSGYRECSSTHGGTRRMLIEFLWENQKEGDHWEDEEVGG
jgi:hypothetical protein